MGMLLACLEISPYICQKIPDMKSTQSFIFTLGLLLALLPTALCAQQTDEGRDDLYVPTSPSLEGTPVDSFRCPLAVDSLQPDSFVPTVLFAPIPYTWTPYSTTSWMHGVGLDGCYGWGGGLYGMGWRLHEGFNAQLGLSTSFGVGRNRMKGVGFGQSAAFAYALPLGKRWSVAASLYAQNMDWGNYHLRDVGVGAVAAFRATERINLYGYVTHSFVRPDWQRTGCLYSPFMDYVRTRVGAMAEFKIGENTFIGISLEHASY